MTAQPTRMETDAERVFREGAEALIAKAPGAEATARRAALAAFVAQGLPDRRREDFHYTDLRAKLREAYPPFVEASLPQRAPFRREEGGSALSALNRALTVSGENISVAPGEAKTATIEAGIAPAGVSVHPRHVVEIGAGARLVLIERHESSNDHLTNQQIDIAVGEGAEVEHIKLLREGRAVHLCETRVNLSKGAGYRATMFALGTRLARHSVHLSLSGEGARASIHSVGLLGGEEHVDFTAHANHEAPHCTSEHEARLVAIGRARGVAQSFVRVAPGARGSDARQMIRGLILGERAEIDARPELEILNDDVKCSHGTALGDLDPEAIFYLRSRGVPEQEARALLIEAFIAEILDKVSHEGARALLKERTREWLRNSLGREEASHG